MPCRFTERFSPILKMPFWFFFNFLNHFRRVFGELLNCLFNGNTLRTVSEHFYIYICFLINMRILIWLFKSFIRILKICFFINIQILIWLFKSFIRILKTFNFCRFFYNVHFLYLNGPGIKLLFALINAFNNILFRLNNVFYCLFCFIKAFISVLKCFFMIIKHFQRFNH